MDLPGVFQKQNTVGGIHVVQVFFEATFAEDQNGRVNWFAEESVFCISYVHDVCRQIWNIPHNLIQIKKKLEVYYSLAIAQFLLIKV